MQKLKEQLNWLWWFCTNSKFRDIWIKYKIIGEDKYYHTFIPIFRKSKNNNIPNGLCIRELREIVLLKQT